MKKFGYLILCVFCFHFSFSQDQLGLNFTQVYDYFESLVEKDTVFKYNFSESRNSLSVKVTGTDSLVFQHFFRTNSDGVFEENSICDSLVIHLLCDSCVNKHFSTILDSRFRKWRKLNDLNYVSSNGIIRNGTSYFVPRLTIIQPNQLHLYHTEMTKEEFKIMKKQSVKYRKS